MNRALDQERLMDALKHASNMLLELRTSLLEPPSYYELYIQITNEMMELERTLLAEHRRGKRIADLYELVQYAGNILPRLYLLITIGSVYIVTKEAPAADLLRDLVEMCKGVQHPTRGLFLRNYLSVRTKDKLPDKNNQLDGTVEMSVNFTIQNFTEMNKLWVRMGYQGSADTWQTRQLERRQLRQLIGANLERLGNLEGVTEEVYVESVLPRLLEQIVSCKDKLAQESLTEYLISAFPAAYHVRSLGKLLEAVGELVPDVDVKMLVITIIDRLARFASSENGKIPPELNVFEIFTSEVAKIMRARQSMPTEDVLSLQVALLNLALQCYPDRNEYVESVLAYCHRLLETAAVTPSTITPAVASELVNLLNIPIDTYPSMLTVLQLGHFDELVALLPFADRSSTAQYIVRSVIRTRTVVDDVALVQKLLTMVTPLIIDEEDAVAVTDMEDFNEEQTLVAKLIHLLRSAEPDVQFQILIAARQAFAQGGDRRLPFTLPPLITGALRLCQIYKRASTSDELWDKKVQKVLKYVHQTVVVLGEKQPEPAMAYFLSAAITASKCGMENICYEFATRAVAIYETLTDSKAQYRAIQSIIASLQAMGRETLSEENYETLVAKLAQHAAHLIHKPDQSRGVFLCSHLVWTGTVAVASSQAATLVRDERGVLSGLQKSLKVASECMDGSAEQISLYVDILEEYLYYYESGNSSVTPKYINGLLHLIDASILKLDLSDPSVPVIQQHYRNVRAHIAKKTAAPEEGRPTYADIS